MSMIRALIELQQHCSFYSLLNLINDLFQSIMERLDIRISYKFFEWIVLLQYREREHLRKTLLIVQGND